MAFHVEVDFSGFPFFAGFDQQGGDEAQEGGFIGKEAGDAGAAFEFLIDPFQGVGSAQPFLVCRWQGEDRQALRQIFFHPGRQLGRALGVVGDEFFEALLGGGASWAVENAADGACDFGALVEARDVGLGILLEMELTTLPGHARKDGRASGFEADVIVTDEELDAVEAALDEALEKGAPMHFGFTESGADAQDGAFAVGTDPEGHEHGTVQHLAVLADFFIAGVQHQIGKSAEGPISPFLEFGVEEFGALADVGGTDGGAAEFLDDGGDAAGGDALNVHFGEGEFEGLLGAESFLEGAGVKIHGAADLRNVESDGPETGGEGFVFEAVGVAGAGLGALVGLGLEDLGTLDAHGLVDEEADAFSEAIGALFGDELQDRVQEIRLGVVGHVWFGVGSVSRHPNRKPAWPALDQFFARGALCPLRGSAALGSLRSPSLRLTPEGAKQMEERQFTERFLHRLSGSNRRDWLY